MLFDNFLVSLNVALHDSRKRGKNPKGSEGF
jgi:hypothetical protein